MAVMTDSDDPRHIVLRDHCDHLLTRFRLPHSRK
jgi:hypothetical protein